MATKLPVSLPSLPLEAWEPTKMTLHLYLQIVGKIQLALMPRKNHWWNITFLPNSKGLITHTIPAGDFSFEMQFNFPEHQLEVITSNGLYEALPLKNGLSVAQFYEQVFSILDRFNIDAKITAHPYSLPDDNPITTPFAELTQYHEYDMEYVERFWHILNWAANVFNEFGGRFYGKTSPVQLFWHHMDLVITRFCGRRAPALPPGTNIANKDAYSHELISFGFWAGDDKVRHAAFYSYAYPAREGMTDFAFKGHGKWTESNGSPMALLNYDDLLTEADPRAALLDFLERCYVAGGKSCQWDVEDLSVPPIDKM